MLELPVDRNSYLKDVKSEALLSLENKTFYRISFSVSVTDCKTISPGIHPIFLYCHWSQKYHPKQNSSKKRGPTTSKLTAF